MTKKLAFVLGGGGARGALQVGALRALYESGYRPHILTGSSIGAANGAFLAVHGFNPHGLERLALAWETASNQDLLPANLWWNTMSVFFKRSNGVSMQRVREFAIANGITPDLRFKDLREFHFHPVAADLNTGCPVVFGQDPEDSVLECVLASMALPPWLMPVDREGRYLVDGGAVSSLPVEAAMLQGARRIIALDLLDMVHVDGSANRSGAGRVGNFLLKLDRTIEGRQTQLEIKLAEARGIPVRHLSLVGAEPVAIWDFRHSAALIEQGYRLTRDQIELWHRQEPLAAWREFGKEVAEGLLEALN